MRIYFLFMLIASAVYCEPASVELREPTDRYFTDERNIYFHYIYHKGDLERTWVDCNLVLDDYWHESVGSVDGETISVYVEDVLPGEHEWWVDCEDVPSNTWSFEIKGEPAEVFAYEPGPGMRSKSKDVRFEFKYVNGSIGPEYARCAVVIDEEEHGELYLPDGKKGSIEIKDFDSGRYRWKIKCDEYYSPSYLLYIESTEPAEVSAIKPEDGYKSSLQEVDFVFSYDRGDAGPRIAECDLATDIFIIKSVEAPDGENVSFSHTFDRPGEYVWDIQCNKNTDHHVMTESRRLTITDRVVVVEDGSDETNESGDPAEDGVGDADAVEQEDVDDQRDEEIVIEVDAESKIEDPVEVKIEKGGDPLSGQKVIVTIPGSENKIITYTDSRGIARFTPPHEGEYEISLDGESVYAKTVVQKKEIVKNEQREDGVKQEKGRLLDDPIVVMFLTVLVFIFAALVILFAFFKKN